MKEENCPFCHILAKQILLENDFAFAIKDIKPLTKGHILIIPKRHNVDCSELSPMEFVAVGQLALECRNQLLEDDESIKGFNYQVNEGPIAGQTVFHYHMHIIPRRENDGLTIIEGRQETPPVSIH